MTASLYGQRGTAGRSSTIRRPSRPSSPSNRIRRHAPRRRNGRATRRSIQVAGGDAASLPAEDGSFDAAVLATVLCSVPDPAFAALQRASDRLFWTRVLGGCETARDTVSAIRAAGFEIVELDRGSHSSSLLTIPSAPYVPGVART